MNYRKSVESSQIVSIVNGKKRHHKNIYVRENIGDKTTFLKHVELGPHSKSLAGTTYDDKMAVVTRVSNGKNVKYSSNVVKSPNNLRKVLRRSLVLNKKRKATRGKGKGTRSKGTRGKGSNKGKQIGKKGSKSKGKGKKGKTRKSSGSK